MLPLVRGAVRKQADYLHRQWHEQEKNDYEIDIYSGFQMEKTIKTTNSHIKRGENRRGQVWSRAIKYATVNVSNGRKLSSKAQCCSGYRIALRVDPAFFLSQPKLAPLLSGQIPQRFWLSRTPKTTKLVWLWSLLRALSQFSIRFGESVLWEELEGTTWIRIREVRILRPGRSGAGAGAGAHEAPLILH